MKTLKNTIIALLVIAISYGLYSCGGSVKLVRGDLGFLDGVKTLKVEYNYDGMGVGSYANEADYVNEKVEKYNEKEEGKGDDWKKRWVGDRKNRYQPKFEELLNKYLEEVDIYVGQNEKDAKYTLILKTTFIEPGYNVFVSRRDALVNTEAIFVESNNKDNVVAKIVIKGQTGAASMGSDFDSGTRIQEGYAKTGKSLGKFIVANM